jgi:hypothetical protein
MPLLSLSLLVLLASCAQFRIPLVGSEKAIEPLKVWRPYAARDYRAQLTSHERSFLVSEGVREVPLLRDDGHFLNNLAVKILQNNELFFREATPPRFHLVSSPVPFHFSLPGRIIFLSTALVNRHVKHEAVLASIVSYELVRSERALYPQHIVVPLGFMPLERMLGLTRLNVDEKAEIHKWAYHAVRRAGFDGEYYLSWLQLMNRNTAEFLPMLGDADAISQEEALFKAFLIKRTKTEDARAVARRDSSREFYRFIFYVKDRT